MGCQLDWRQYYTKYSTYDEFFADTWFLDTWPCIDPALTCGIWYGSEDCQQSCGRYCKWSDRAHWQYQWAAGSHGHFCQPPVPHFQPKGKATGLQCSNSLPCQKGSASTLDLQDVNCSVSSLCCWSADSLAYNDGRSCYTASWLSHEMLMQGLLLKLDHLSLHIRHLWEKNHLLLVLKTFYTVLSLGYSTSSIYETYSIN